MKQIIRADKISKKYPVPVKQGFVRTIFWPKFETVTAVENVSFEINEGDSVGLLGPNGAGKTTTLKMLSGLLEPSSGEITVLENTPHDRKREFLKQIAMVLGNKNSLSWELSALQNFAILQAIYDIEEKDMRKQIDELAVLLETTSILDRPIRKLSLGQRLKMELIGAILHRPKLLFLDEPTLGLDIIAKRKIREFIKERNEKEGATIILTSHDMADVEKVVNRIMVINQGRLIFDGSMSNLLSQYKSKKYLVVHLEEEVSKDKISQFGKLIDVKEMSFTIEINEKDQAEIIGKITDTLPVDDIDISHVPLEEIIADLFGKGLDRSP